MPSPKRDMREALKGRILAGDRPQIAETPGERGLPGAKLVALTRVRANPDQPRKRFDLGALDELAASIRERGVMQPLVVRPHGEGYEIIMGERRYRAAERTGLTEVPVIVRAVSDEQALLDALAENVQRQNLTDDEEAEAYRGLLGRGFGVRQIAAQLSIAPSKVSRVLRIYGDEALAAAVADGQITKSDAQELLLATPEAKPGLIAAVAARRRTRKAMDRAEIRVAVRETKGGVALRNTSAQPSNEARTVALRTTATISHSSVAKELGDETVSIPASLQEARDNARALRALVERRVIVLQTWVDDPVIAAELTALYQVIDGCLHVLGGINTRPRNVGRQERLDIDPAATPVVGETPTR